MYGYYRRLVKQAEQKEARERLEDETLRASNAAALRSSVKKVAGTRTSPATKSPLR